MESAYQIRDQNAAYYFTFQVVGWADVFSRQVYRDIITDSLRYCPSSKGMKLYTYVIMTNHVHVIMSSTLRDLSGLIRDFKKHTSQEILRAVSNNRKGRRTDWLQMIFKYHAKYNKRAGDVQLWTHENHAVEMNSNDRWDSRLHYIHENPVRAVWIIKPEDDLYSSARNYAGEENQIAV